MVGLKAVFDPGATVIYGNEFDARMFSHEVDARETSGAVLWAGCDRVTAKAEVSIVIVKYSIHDVYPYAPSVRPLPERWPSVIPSPGRRQLQYNPMEKKLVADWHFSDFVQVISNQPCSRIRSMVFFDMRRL